MTTAVSGRGLMKVAVAAAFTFGVNALAQPLAIVHATLIDVSAFGRSERDIDDAVVLIEGDHIVAVGQESTVRIPSDAKVVDARGAFLVPGLIDGFAALRDQGFANAFLFEGVTTVYLPSVDGSDDRRGKGFLLGDPSPRVFIGGAVTGYSVLGLTINGKEMPADAQDGALTQERLTQDPLTRTEIDTRVRQIALTGARGVWIDYDVWPYQIDTTVKASKALGLGTIGELGFTSYSYAIRAGIATLVHSQRYLSSLALPVDQLRYADDPFGKGNRSAIKAEPD